MLKRRLAMQNLVEGPTTVLFVAHPDPEEMKKGLYVPSKTNNGSTTTNL